MDTKQKEFFDYIKEGYTCSGESIIMGAAMLGEDVIKNAYVEVPLKMMNRHGLIAGATGTGKTKTLQVIAENLSQKGVPVLLMDIKGDLSGIAKASDGHAKIDERHTKIGFPFEASSSPVEVMTLSEQNGVRLRATISEFGPVLLSRILDVTETQAGILSVIFKYCDDHNMPLLDIKDLKKMLQFTTGEGKKEFQEEYGRISSSSTGSIMRKLIELEQQGGDLFFGEKSFEVDDLMRLDEEGKAFVNIIRLNDIQDKPKLFSTFMLSLLAEIYGSFPEQGDSDRPELVIFIDEAHLIFKQASNELLEQIESIVKLIRSKGVGLFFVTQNPTDLPEEVLAQLGLKVQHALRAFTAKDRKAIKLAAQNFPESEYYDTAELLTSLGIGEALISSLDEKGRPTPLAATHLRAPMSRMDILEPNELRALINGSKLVPKYAEAIDRQSAYEMLNEKIAQAQQREQMEKVRKENEKLQKSRSSRRSSSSYQRQNPVVKVLTSATFIRGVMGIITKAMNKK